MENSDFNIDLMSEEFKKYLNELIGVIKLDDPNLDMEYVHHIDAARIIQSKHAIASMIQSISGENIIVLFNKDTKGLRNFGEIDALDLDILLNHLVLGVLVSIKNKNKMCLKHYNDKVLYIENLDALTYNHSIIYSADYYDKEITELINKRQITINELLETNTPNANLANELEQRFLMAK